MASNTAKHNWGSSLVQDDCIFVYFYLYICICICICICIHICICICDKERINAQLNENQALCKMAKIIWIFQGRWFFDKESNAHLIAHHNMASYTGNVDALDAELIVWNEVELQGIHWKIWIDWMWCCSRELQYASWRASKYMKLEVGCREVMLSASWRASKYMNLEVGCREAECISTEIASQ